MEAKLWGVIGSEACWICFLVSCVGGFIVVTVCLSNLCYISLGPSDAHFRVYYKKYFDDENHSNEELNNALC